MAPQDKERSPAYAYEAVFCIFLLAVAVLGRWEADWVYPQVLWGLVALLSLNLGTGLALRRRPAGRLLSAGAVLANCAVVTALLEYSGGRDSLLWVLYLLPVFTSSMFLRSHETAWVAGGAIAFNAAFCVLSDGPLVASDALDVGLRSGVLALAAALTWRLAERERRAVGQLDTQRRELASLMGKLEVRTTQEASARRLAEVGLITAGVLHDLKTPLTVILGFAEVGLTADDAASMRRDFERIRSAGLLCRDIVGTVLAAAGAATAERVRVDLVAVARAALDLCAPILERKGIRLSAELPETRMSVDGSREQLERLVLNLVTNAAQAAARGGRVRVRLGWGPVRAGVPSATLTVADDGPGISPEAAAGMFQPFKTTKKAEGGTGLGLYICREVALSHGGSMTAGNGPDGGAEFAVSLPLAREAETVAEPEPAEAR
ncbi:MAG: HAMP domain-containing histidine kinase [Elusimicrobia bacterium]|nr:HAMP domain-containing histidine kinase [Elusimicrobiota bacterium]